MCTSGLQKSSLQTSSLSLQLLQTVTHTMYDKLYNIIMEATTYVYYDYVGHLQPQKLY